MSSKLFSKKWMVELAKLWNSDPKMTRNLAKVDFCSLIGYGFTGEENPRGYIFVDGGKVVSEGTWDGEELNWDLRASRESWKKWLQEGFGLVRLGKAVTSGELKFEKGDYRQMVSNIKLSVPFLRHLELMSEIKTDYNV
ncbi:MAG: SCP-2 sterol transfer family protein [Acidiferrobacterales bacterium]